MPDLPQPVPPLPRPMSPEEMAQLQEAKVRYRLIRRAVGYARFDGWSVALLGGLTLICGLFSVWGVILGIVMIGIGAFELITLKKFLNFEPRSARFLAWNQLVFCLLLVSYFTWQLIAQLTGPGAAQDLISREPELREYVKDLEPVVRQMMAAMYAALIVLSILAQGGAAWFYFRRERMIEQYVHATPPWIVQMQQAGISL